MKHMASILALSALVLLCGCGGGATNRISDFRSTSAGPEHCRQLAIQHDRRDDPLDDCGQYQSIRQFGKRRSAC